jgi:DNA-binding transcriptional MerR regulator
VTIGIGDLARRTGLTQQLVRAWESRFGFPTPQRTESGRRVYSEADVDRVQRVLALKDAGLRLAQAIDRVRAEETSGPLSVYAALRERHPQVESRILRRDVLVAISHAIEDEAMSRASRPVVFGAFQRESFYLQAAPRWHEIARTAACCVVFADFAAPSGRTGSPVEVPLAADAPLLREWAVVVTAPSLSVALAGWEIPRRPGGTPGLREFESIFTFDPAAVRTAAQVCLGVARAGGTVPAPLLTTMSESLATEPTPSHGVDSLVVRAFDYLQHLTRHAARTG